MIIMNNRKTIVGTGSLCVVPIVLFLFVLRGGVVSLTLNTVVSTDGDEYSPGAVLVLVVPYRQVLAASLDDRLDNRIPRAPQRSNPRGTSDSRHGGNRVPQWSPETSLE